jgi:hypothetical protein
MRKHIALGVIALGMGGTAYAAEEVSHTFVEAGYGITDVQLPGESGGADGFVIGGSLELPQNFVVSARYRDRSYDDDLLAGLDESTISAGVAYAWGLSDSVDVLAGVSYERVKLDTGGNSISESGFALQLGARALLTERFELGTTVKYTDMELEDTSISGFSLSAGGRYYFTPNFAGGIDYVSEGLLGFSEATFIASLRYSFGSLF